MKTVTPSIADRIEANVQRVTESGCWIWMASTFNNGYGQMKVRQENRGAHRVSYEVFVGPIPDGMHVLHRCDNRPCVNPHHLFIGTQKDNMRDKANKGRCAKNLKSFRGTDNSQSKLTDSQVVEIRKQYTGKYGEISRLSREFGVSRPVIKGIVDGTLWKHVQI